MANQSVTYMKNGTPRIIHQVWINPNPSFPKKSWNDSPVLWQKYHPNYIYHLWRDADVEAYLQTYHPDAYEQLYKKYKYIIQRADMIRYFILYDFGGIYSDLDILPTECLEPWLEKSSGVSLVLSAATNCTTNAFMVSTQYHPFWLEVQKQLYKGPAWWAWTKHFIVMTSTSPMMLDRVFRETKELVTLLPRYYFNSYDYLTHRHRNATRPLLIALEGSSWHSLDSTLMNVLGEQRQNLPFILLIFICAIVIIVLTCKLIIARNQ